MSDWRDNMACYWYFNKIKLDACARELQQDWRGKIRWLMRRGPGNSTMHGGVRVTAAKSHVPTAIRDLDPVAGAGDASVDESPKLCIACGRTWVERAAAHALVVARVRRHFSHGPNRPPSVLSIPLSTASPIVLSECNTVMWRREAAGEGHRFDGGSFARMSMFHATEMMGFACLARANSLPSFHWASRLAWIARGLLLSDLARKDYARKWRGQYP